MTDRCRSCGAEIICQVDGKSIPLNKRRVRGYRRIGNYISGETGEKTPIWTKTEDPIHISHFITCPNASSHSKAKT